jgi:hypothetical protein
MNDQPKLVGHSQEATTSNEASVYSAWRAAHSRAIIDAGEPSIPATIRRFFAGWLLALFLVSSGEVISHLFGLRPSTSCHYDISAEVLLVIPRAA